MIQYKVLDWWDTQCSYCNTDIIEPVEQKDAKILLLFSLQRTCIYFQFIVQSPCVITIIFYNGNFDFQRNVIGNGSILIKIWYIIMEFALSNTNADSRRLIAFFIHFYSLNDRKKSSNKLFTDKKFQLAVSCYAHCRKWQLNQGRLVAQWPCNYQRALQGSYQNSFFFRQFDFFYANFFKFGHLSQVISI